MLRVFVEAFRHLHLFQNWYYNPLWAITEKAHLRVRSVAKAEDRISSQSPCVAGRATGKENYSRLPLRASDLEKSFAGRPAPPELALTR